MQVVYCVPSICILDPQEILSKTRKTMCNKPFDSRKKNEEKVEEKYTRQFTLHNFLHSQSPPDS